MNFTLNILGTASALPTSDRYSSAHVLDVHGRLFLIDCGEGTQMQMRRMGISFLKVDTICLSHIHGDHIFGIFGLLSTMGMLGRTSVLNVYAPAAFRPVLDFFMKTFGEGMRFEVDMHELSCRVPEVIAGTRTVELLAFPLQHRVETYGFMVREKEPAFNVKKDCIDKYGLTLAEIGTLKRGEDVVRYSEEGGVSEVITVPEAAYKPFVPRSYAYCSDTVPFPELSVWVKGADLLYHEATYPAEMKEMAVRNWHSTTEDAARCALEAGAGKLVIGHYSSRYTDLTRFLDQARAVFPETVLARELDSIEIPLKKAESC